jgi:N-acetylmuramoyl-L-alanine amidase
MLCAALLAMCAGATEAARPATIELRSRSGTLGSLAQVALEEGGVYVSAERLAALLKGTWTVKGSRGTLTVGPRSANFNQNQSRITLLGAPVTLQAPPRVSSSGWLLPDDFLAKGLAKLAPGVTVLRVAAAATAPKREPRPPRPTVVFEDLRFRSYPSFTRIVIEAAGAVPYTVEADRSGIRVRLARLALPAPQAQEIDDGLVSALRLEPDNGDAVLRVTLAGTVGQVKDSVLQDPYRVVLDIHRPKEPAGPDGGRPAIQPLRLIVLDAGHGGHDPGAIGPSGLQEKEVVLDVTRRVARMAEDGLGAKVVLTRGTDVFVPLRERTNFANKQRADLFVSIHANAHPRAVSEGVETYFLSSEASDTEARQVAAIENGAVQLETPASRQKTDLLKSILWDLAQSEFQQESSFLAETVQDSMTQSMRLVNRGVKQAGFYVLGGAAMPAILVEIGFLTNPREERKLATPEYREAAARAIYAGLTEYKRRYDQRLRTAQAVPARPERTAPR